MIAESQRASHAPGLLEDMVNWPDFLVIGAGKAGTTALNHRLAVHPQLFMSPVKEPNFFALEGMEVPQRDDSPEQTRHYPWAVTERHAYQALFCEAEPEQRKGEVSPMYLYSEAACEKIAAYAPGMKLIAVLRQPAERLYSRYLHLARENRAPQGGLEGAFDRQSIWWRRDDLVAEGFYGRYLQRYFDRFPREQILVLFYEDLQRQPEKVLEQIAAFLEIAPHFPEVSVKEHNVSGLIRRRWLDRLIGQQSALKSAVDKLAPVLIERLRQNERAQTWLHRMRKHNLERPALNATLKQRITRELYREDLELLEAVLGRSLQHWKS